MKILIKDVDILTMVNERVVFGDIGIIDDKIEFVGKKPANFIPDKTIKSKNFLAMPGLINAHTHISMSLLRGYADDLPFWEWLNDKIMPCEEKLTPRDVYVGAKLSIAEMILGGTTCFNDMYDFMNEVARASQDSGIRACIGRGLMYFTPQDNQRLVQAEELYNRWHNKAEGRIRTILTPHAPYTCAKEFLQKVISLRDRLDLPIHIHLSESIMEMEEAKKNWSKTPIEYVRDLGLLDGKVLAAHCVQLTDNDIKILKEKNVSVVNNPGSNLKLANGFAPVDKMLKAGINVCLGTDGPASGNNQNMFEEINLAALLNKGITKDPLSVPAYKALQMATINGAVALGIDDKVGTLQKGKQADIILIDMNKPHLCPKRDVISCLAYSAQASDVSLVMVNGKILMEDRILKTLDIETIQKEAQICSDRVVR